MAPAFARSGEASKRQPYRVWQFFLSGLVIIVPIAALVILFLTLSGP